MDTTLNPIRLFLRWRRARRVRRWRERRLIATTRDMDQMFGN